MFRQLVTCVPCKIVQPLSLLRRQLPRLGEPWTFRLVRAFYTRLCTFPLYIRAASAALLPDSPEIPDIPDIPDSKVN